MNIGQQKIDNKWSDYDKLVAKCHLENFGKIYLDEYGCPIDNETELEKLTEKQQNIIKK